MHPVGKHCLPLPACCSGCRVVHKVALLHAVSTCSKRIAYRGGAMVTTGTIVTIAPPLHAARNANPEKKRLPCIVLVYRPSTPTRPLPLRGMSSWSKMIPSCFNRLLVLPPSPLSLSVVCPPVVKWHLALVTVTGLCPIHGMSTRSKMTPSSCNRYHLCPMDRMFTCSKMSPSCCNRYVLCPWMGCPPVAVWHLAVVTVSGVTVTCYAPWMGCPPVAK